MGCDGQPFQQAGLLGMNWVLIGFMLFILACFRGVWVAFKADVVSKVDRAR
jgi:hypothetical protein